VQTWQNVGTELIGLLTVRGSPLYTENMPWHVDVSDGIIAWKFEI
jgi:hypothetical protein